MEEAVLALMNVHVMQMQYTLIQISFIINCFSLISCLSQHILMILPICHISVTPWVNDHCGEPFYAVFSMVLMSVQISANPSPVTELPQWDTEVYHAEGLIKSELPYLGQNVLFECPTREINAVYINCLATRPTAHQVNDHKSNQCPTVSIMSEQTYLN